MSTENACSLTSSFLSLPFQGGLLPTGHWLTRLCQTLRAVWALQSERSTTLATINVVSVDGYPSHWVFSPAHCPFHTCMLFRWNKLWMQAAFSFYKRESTKALNGLNKATWLGKNQNWNVSSGLSGSALYVLLCCFKMAVGRALGQSSVIWHTIHFDVFFKIAYIFKIILLSIHYFYSNILYF